MKAPFLLSAMLLAATSFLGCSADPGDEGEGEELVSESEDGLTSASNFGYFRVVRRDFRKCVSPLCGGFYVKRVNQAQTRCADGTLADECYVGSISLKGVGLSDREESEFRGALEEGKALVRARTFKTKAFGTTIGTLKASEAWLGVTGSDPEDVSVFRVAHNGIVCITTPCPSTTAYWLNSHESQNIVKLNLGSTANPASQEQIDAATNRVGTEEGILVAGGLALPKCLPSAKSCGPFVTATEFYTRVVRRENKSCGGHTIGGQVPCNAGQYCNWAPGDFCGAADAPGKCTYKPELCNKLFAPVCACDGNTYGNACMAAAAGYSVASSGVCATP